jgi:hypothetical protein
VRKSLFLALCFFLTHIAAHADPIEDALNQKYKAQILALRSPFTKGDQKFDSAGQPANTHADDRWLAYGAIYVDTLSLLLTLCFCSVAALPSLEHKKTVSP